MLQNNRILILLTYSFLLFFLLFFIDACQENENRPQKIAHSIQSGEAFLLKQLENDQYYLRCDSTGRPCPFDQSGETLTSFFMVTALDKSIPKPAQNKIISMIAKNNRAMKWAYSPPAPIDADDTAFVLQTLGLLGMQQNISGLLSFYHPISKGFSALMTDKDLGLTLPVTVENTFNGQQADVNANIYNLLHLLHRDELINYDLIRKAQADEGYWYGYYYPGKYYSTYLNLKLLCAAKKLPVEVNKGLRFIQSSQNHDGSWGDPGNPYDTALALNALSTCNYKASKSTIKNGTNYLLSTQNKKGYWDFSFPNAFFIFVCSDTTTYFVYDIQHVVTTSLAVLALKNGMK